MLFVLRKHGKPLAGVLTSLLLASWLGLFCDSCLAGLSTAKAPDAAGAPCHDTQPELHGCCDHNPDCADATLPDAINGDASSLLPQMPEWNILTGPVPHVDRPPGTTARLLPFFTGPPGAPETPAYLRFCTFLN